MLCSMLCNSASLAHTINYSARCGNKRLLCLLAPSHALLGLFMEGRPRLPTGLPGWCLWTWSLSPPPWPFLSQYGHSQGLNGEFFAYMGPGPGARGPEAQMPGAHICYNLPSRTCRPCSPSSSQPSADTWLGKLWHTWARGPGPRASESLGPGPGGPGPESGPRPRGRGPRGRPGVPGPRAYVC